MNFNKAIDMERDKLRKSSRYPYTYACDAVRNTVPEVSSRAEASEFISRRASEKGMEKSDLAKALAEGALVEMALTNLSWMARDTLGRQVRNLLGIGEDE